MNYKNFEKSVKIGSIITLKKEREANYSGYAGRPTKFYPRGTRLWVTKTLLPKVHKKSGTSDYFCFCVPLDYSWYEGISVNYEHIESIVVPTGVEIEIMQEINARELYEQITGCYQVSNVFQRNLKGEKVPYGRYFRDHYGKILDCSDAYVQLREGKEVQMVNAGGGSFFEFFRKLGAEKIIPIHNGNNHKLFVIAICIADIWLMASQDIQLTDEEGYVSFALCPEIFNNFNEITKYYEKNR